MASGSWDRGQKLSRATESQTTTSAMRLASAGERAVVGAPGADHYRGAAYVFESDGSVWGEAQKLLATGGAESDQFGNSVALAPGASSGGRVLERGFSRCSPRFRA